jgi:acetyltransferase
LAVENLKGFFNPQAIAIIGAGEQRNSLGTRILCNLIGAYRGSIFPVNPFSQTVQGIRAYPSISRVPSKVDLVIIATPAHTVPQIVEECGKAGALNVIIVSAGFNECDQTGQDLTRQILNHKKTYGMKIIGPNSFGVVRPNINLYATFAEKKAVPPGKIAFVSQSAALCGAALDWSAETQVGLSAVVSTGSTVDVDFGDLIDYFGNDFQTRVIMLYAESIKNVRNFMSAARGYAKTKPIIIVKAGRGGENQNFSVFDARVLKDAVYEAAFKRCGIVQVETVGDLFDCAKTLSMQPSPSSPNLTIITNASGPALMAQDQINARGGKLSKISDATVQVLKKILPFYCGLTNPIDILEEATPERYRKVIQACLNDDSSGSLLVMYTPIGLTDPQSLANIVVDLFKQSRNNVFVCLMGEDPNCQEARRMLQQNGVPAFRSPEEAVRTFMNIYAHTQNLELLYQTPEEFSLNPLAPAYLKGIIRKAFCEGRQVLNLAESLQILEAYKIPTAKTFFAKTSREVEALAIQLSFPAVMKAVYSRLSLKHEIVENAIDVCSLEEIADKFKKLSDESKCLNVTVEFQGVAIQPKVPGHPCQLFLGSRKDPQFGAIVCLGSGGALAGQVKDYSVGFPPLNQVLARQIMKNAKALKYCKSTAEFSRSGAALVEQILIRFSQLVMDFPEINQIDINPINISADEVYAVDAQIVIDLNKVMREAAEHHEHLVIAPYPKKYVTKRTLKNGAKVTLRPIKPEDENRFNELFKSLSAQSVRFRFFETIKELSHDTRSRYCNLDYDREIAIVAELEDDGRIIGVVRLILDVERKNAEFAIMISDSWHGLGLGSKLMDYIIDIAKDFRLSKIYSQVDPENFKMLGLCTKKGFEINPVDEFTTKTSLTLHS